MNHWKKISLDGTWNITWISNDDIRLRRDARTGEARTKEAGGKADGEKEARAAVRGEALREDSGEVFPRTIAELEGYGEGTVRGSVPGNFELALEENGILPEIFRDQNILLLQKYEGYHVFYSRSFLYHAEEGCTPYLYFEGIDTISEIWVNGRLAGRTENMFIPHSLPAGELREGENEIVVHLFPVSMESRKRELSFGNTSVNKYNFESLWIRKAAHMYGWDIMPRAVSCGIWRPVSLVYRPEEFIRQAYVCTLSADRVRKEAELMFFYEVEARGADLSRYSIEIEGGCGDSRFYARSRLWNVAGRFRFPVKDAKLWEPREFAAQDPAHPVRTKAHLYDVAVRLVKDGEVIDTDSFRTGLRTVELVRTGLTDLHLSGDFHFKVNGEKVFILGTNFVPVDAFHSRDRERLPRVCSLLLDVGCNAIRIWGGNVYEDDYLYDYCDEHGILIWQDFMMACGVYPEEDAFREEIARETRAAVRRLRHHASILCWAGDNENDMVAFMEPFHRNPNRNSLTREVIPRVLEYEDPSRPYLPSSPFIDEACVGQPLEYITEQHLWGPRDYFRNSYYTKSLGKFASEIGYHGCCSVASMEKFISKEMLWPWEDNPAWAVHAACPETGMIDTWGWRIHLMANQIREMFGRIPETPEDFALCSQISQAEAFKFFIELFRVENGRRSGIIWWNLIDGWHQFSDAVVDYYFTKKLAYYYIQNSQRALLLTFAEPADWHLTLTAVNDTGRDTEVEYEVYDYATGQKAAQGRGTVRGGAGAEAAVLDRIPYSYGEKHIYVITWKSEYGEGRNHYLSGQPPFDLEIYRDFVKDFYRTECWL